MSLHSILECLCSGPEPHDPNHSSQSNRGAHGLVVKKPALFPPAYSDAPILTPQQQAENMQAGIDIVALLCATDKTGAALRAELEAAAPVRNAGWSEWLAESTFNALRDTVKKAVDGPETKWAATFTDAYKVAKDTAEEHLRDFLQDAKAHPGKIAVEVVGEIVFSLVAFGILVRLMRWTITLLGFGELGPVAGSFAARWEARYAGYIPRGSLFSYMQRMGMTWG